MSSVTNTVSTHTKASQHTVRASDLISLLDQFDNKLHVLSLDCFDTILWRKTTTPVDVFFAIQNRPLFKSLGFTARLRAQAEATAREKMLLNKGKSEVTLQNIYSACYPALTPEQLSQLEDEELDCELDACYAFPPVVELIKHAYAKNIKVIIVSDTYLTQSQLQHLLNNALPTDVVKMIHHIYCSSEVGVSKSNGMFTKVINSLRIHPHAMLHIGDNYNADYHAPSLLNMHTAHLIHQDTHIAGLLRMQALAGGFIDLNIRNQRPLYSPFAGLLATQQLDEALPAKTIGYASVGQIMYAFSRFLQQEVQQLKNQGKNRKVVFLMRDAYLPSLACETLTGSALGKRIYISRYAAIASSFCCKDDIDRYLASNVLSYRFYDMCKQLLLSDDLTKQIVDRSTQAAEPLVEFIKSILQKSTLEQIYQASKSYRQRLYRYLEKQIDLKNGDTLVFVDLGYTGTAQIKLEPIFREEMQIDIIGRYLISLCVPNWESSRRALLDPSWCDDRTLHMFVAYIALFEQLCTSDDRSVINYDDEGNPIFSETSVSKKQSANIDMIQQECLHFISDANNFFQTTGTDLSLQMLRDVAMAELGRLLFFPTQSELSYMSSFEFDLNLGTRDLLNVFDTEKGLEGLRRRGYFLWKEI